MNKIETVVYNLVRKNPALKQFIRNCYQSVFDLLPKEKEYHISPLFWEEGYFFGFHDVSPFSTDETKLLANKLSFDLRTPLPNEGLTVGYFHISDNGFGEYVKLGESFAWNYHKGCRLQWLNNSQVIFNTAKDNKLCSEIIDINSGEKRTIPYPIDTVHDNYATSFSYQRLDRCMPGYGYPYSDDAFTDESAPAETGLFLIDLTTGERELLLSVKEIALSVASKVEEEYLHFVTHTEFSPDGRYISFLYRRIPKTGDYMKRRSVICVYDRIEKKLIILPSQESGSHYVWNNENKIIASCIIDNKSCHVLFDINNPNNIRLVAPDKLNSDGHQSFINNKAFVTDTYPDRRRMAKLYATDLEGKNVRLIGKFFSPKKFQTKDFHCHIACDLHPRVSPSGKYVCFDSPRTGKRAICLMKL